MAKSHRESDTKEKLGSLLHTIKEDLDRTVDFWINSSHDKENGGFFTCLSKEGEVYDDQKYCWLQGRQVWMYAKLYNELERYHVPQLIDWAEQGAEFLLRNVKDPTTCKCYFLLSKDGKPVSNQRTIFTECFYLMAMAELARATKKKLYRDEAIGMFEKIKYWVLVDDTELGYPKLEGQVPTNSLAIPMMAMCICQQLITLDVKLKTTVSDLLNWSVVKILDHIQRDGDAILEHVSDDGKELSGSKGRVTIPGHIIEAGWFLLSFAEKKGDDQLKDTAIEKFITAAFERGWDKKFGGLYYYLDVDGWCPTQLEWSQKLWWPHAEAMIAFLMSYKHTKNITHLESFEKVFDYVQSKFVDTTYGEWYGYLNRDGSINMDFKGGPFKGCFHVPRCLLMCEQMLEELLSEKT